MIRMLLMRMMMNDKIYELAQQAAEFADANEFAAIERRIWDSIFRNKFAELIIKECMTQIQQVREIEAGHASPEYTQGFIDGKFVTISTIEEHFGVEE